MQEQLDMLILDRVSDGFFDITIDATPHNKDIAYEYRGRGFNVRYGDKQLTIKWTNPELNPNIEPNKKIYALFTASHLYNALTKGQDLRRITNVVMYERLIRETQIVDTYGMDRTSVYNLFSIAIIKAESKGFDISINEYGVITISHKDSMNINDFRPT